MSKNCQNCGAVCGDGEEVCRQCGAALPPPVSENKSVKRSVWSIVSLTVAILGIVFLELFFKVGGGIFIAAFFVFSLASVILPPVAKKIRCAKRQKGEAFEIIAIIVGGFDFYMIIFAFTHLPLLIGYLGWVVCALVYKFIW